MLANNDSTGIVTKKLACTIQKELTLLDYLLEDNLRLLEILPIVSSPPLQSIPFVADSRFGLVAF